VTRLGDIVLRPEYDRAPITSRHFLALVREGWLKHAAFYRVVRAMPTGGGPPTIDVIQGGAGFTHTIDMPGVAHESTVITGLSHTDGAVSLARGGDKPAQGEFFICLGDNVILNGGGPPPPAGQGEGFAVFAKVVEGLDVVRAIHQLPSDAPVPGGDPRFEGQFLDRPITIDWRID
jgi:peptidyl-prolyl cis-trans isomerase A (cyclophilin A)